MKLTSEAIRFRWIHNRLPQSIEEFAKPDQVLDPSSGTKFEYRIVGKWFVISRHATDEIGDLNLGEHYDPIFESKTGSSEKP